MMTRHGKILRGAQDDGAALRMNDAALTTTTLRSG
jgi:hypothetical protein